MSKSAMNWHRVADDVAQSAAGPDGLDHDALVAASTIARNATAMGKIAPRSSAPVSSKTIEQLVAAAGVKKSKGKSISSVTGVRLSADGTVVERLRADEGDEPADAKPKKKKAKAKKTKDAPDAPPPDDEDDDTDEDDADDSDEDEDEDEDDEALAAAGRVVYGHVGPARGVRNAAKGISSKAVTDPVLRSFVQQAKKVSR